MSDFSNIEKRLQKLLRGRDIPIPFSHIDKIYYDISEGCDIERLPVSIFEQILYMLDLEEMKPKVDSLMRNFDTQDDGYCSRGTFVLFFQYISFVVLTHRDMIEIGSIFDTIDTENLGVLTKENFQQFVINMERLDAALLPILSEWPIIFKTLDGNNDGVIDRDEWVEGFFLKNLFIRMNITKNRLVINRRAFQVLMKHSNISAYRANEIFTTIDLNWDQALDVEEIRTFKEHLQSSSWFSKSWEIVILMTQILFIIALIWRIAKGNEMIENIVDIFEIICVIGTSLIFLELLLNKEFENFQLLNTLETIAEFSAEEMSLLSKIDDFGYSAERLSITENSISSEYSTFNEDSDSESELTLNNDIV